MEDWSFNCPAYLAQRFWLHCAERNETAGTLLRRFMIAEISRGDPDFEVDLEKQLEHELLVRGRSGRRP